MDAYEEARTIYRDGRQVLDVSRDRAVYDDLVRWTREDLEDALLDLKQAVLDLDTYAVREHTREALKLIAFIHVLLQEDDGDR